MAKLVKGEQNGWNEYSKLVIAELERLNDGIANLNTEIQDLKREIAELKVKEDFAKELWKWKQAVDEVASPTQLKYTVRDVADLKTFRTQAITIWAVVQLITAAVISFLNFYK
jgi:ribosomal protein L29